VGKLFGERQGGNGYGRLAPQKTQQKKYPNTRGPEDRDSFLGQGWDRRGLSATDGVKARNFR